MKRSVRAAQVIPCLAAASALAALMLACHSPSPEPIAAGAGPKIAPGRTLLPVAEGAWQVFYLTDAWVAHHLGDGARRAWMRLAPAHPQDIEDDNGPCPAAQRIVLGTLDDGGAISERTLACLHVCGPGEPDGSLYRGLWASATHLEGLTAQLRADGSIAVIEHYRELAFTTPELAEDPAVAVKLRFGSGSKALARSIAASEFAFPAGEARSCVALEEGL